MVLQKSLCGMWYQGNLHPQGSGSPGPCRVSLLQQEQPRVGCRQPRVQRGEGTRHRLPSAGRGGRFPFPPRQAPHPKDHPDCALLENGQFCPGHRGRVALKRFHFSCQKQRSRSSLSFTLTLAEETRALSLLCTGGPGPRVPLAISPGFPSPHHVRPRSLQDVSRPTGVLGRGSPGCFLGTCRQLLCPSTCFTALPCTVRPHFRISSSLSDAGAQVLEHINHTGEFSMAHHV